MEMEMLKQASMVGVLALLSAGWAVAADEPGGPAGERRAHMQQWCKDNPEQCREAMQKKREEWWKRVDTDGDGSVSRAEAQANAPRLAKNFDQVDANGDGKVSREELEAAGKQARHARGKDWWKKVDADGDGSISREEADTNAPRLAKDFTQIDANADGKITPEELKAARKR
jgi:Ca2+-binding EF-hand superfamily protein